MRESPFLALLLDGQRHFAQFYSVLELDGENTAEFLCWPRVDLGMSRLFLEQLVVWDPQAEHVATCRQSQCRFKRTGQFRSPPGDEALLCLEMFWRNERCPVFFPHVASVDPVSAELSIAIGRRLDLA
jgi:hypothetical protein